MKKTQIFKIATLVLLVLNLTLMAFFLFSPPHRPPGHRPGSPKQLFRGKAIAILKLDDAQADQFKELAKGHSKQMVAADAEKKVLLSRYFAATTQPDKQADSRAASQEVPKIEQRKIEYTYQHFMDVKSILREDQHGNFEEFVKKALNTLLMDEGPKHPPIRKPQ